MTHGEFETGKGAQPLESERTPIRRGYIRATFSRKGRRER